MMSFFSCVVFFNFLCLKPNNLANFIQNESVIQTPLMFNSSTGKLLVTLIISYFSMELTFHLSEHPSVPMHSDNLLPLQFVLMFFAVCVEVAVMKI